MTENSRSAPLSQQAREALRFMGTHDGEAIVTSEGLWADAYNIWIHWQTARALERRGLVTWEDYGDEMAVKLTAAGKDAAEEELSE
jgi:hypothetical protein